MNQRAEFMTSNMINDERNDQYKHIKKGYYYTPEEILSYEDCTRNTEQ